ncbi:MAG: Trm112 family protein [Holophaga sp.]|nr:Trm112 family protein [Holophaga sp.]
MEILCCPAEQDGQPCEGDLVEQPTGMLCQACGLLYPIVDGIPVMLVEEARKAQA